MNISVKTKKNSKIFFEVSQGPRYILLIHEKNRARKSHATVPLNFSAQWTGALYLLLSSQLIKVICSMRKIAHRQCVYILLLNTITKCIGQLTTTLKVQNNDCQFGIQGTTPS